MSTLMEFPAGVFGLERHETFAIERFAYNVARAGGQILSKYEASLELHITFSDEPYFDVWVSMLPMSRGNKAPYQINASAISPQIILGICHEVGTKISPFNFQSSVELAANSFEESVQRFKTTFGLYDSANSTVLIDRLRASSIQLGGFSCLVPETINAFDLVSQFIVNHEAAHAATGQFLKGTFAQEYGDKALEIVADIAATEWQFTRMIRLTPDNDQYRKMLGTSSHSESILFNTYSVIHSQLIVLALISLAPSLINNASPSLSGGSTHPNGYARHFLQYVTFTTLLLSNFKEYLRTDDINKLDKYWEYVIKILMDEGVLSVSDMTGFFLEMVSGSYFDKAAEYIERNDIKALARAAPLLRYFGRAGGTIIEKMRTRTNNLLS